MGNKFSWTKGEYVIESPEDDAIKALPEPYQDSAWIGFYLNTHDALALEDERLEEMGECEERLHMTLAMTRALNYEQRAELVSKLNLISYKASPLLVETTGKGMFDLPDSDCVVCHVSMTYQLIELRKMVVEACGDLLNEPFGFTPHITLCYMPKGTDHSMIEVPKLDLSLVVMTFATGTVNYNYSLGYGAVGVQDWSGAIEDDEEETELEEEDDEMDDMPEMDSEETMPSMKAVPFFDVVGQRARAWVVSNERDSRTIEGVIEQVKRFGEYEGLKATKDNPVVWINGEAIQSSEVELLIDL